jgi:cytochrome c553
MKRAPRHFLFGARVIGVSLLASTLLTTEAGASPSPSDAWRAECGSCHVAFPARALPARSWRAIMDGLERHFGADASVDTATAASIRTYLEANAGRDRSPGEPTALRITETRWFRHEHDEVPGTVWRSPKVKSAADCAACHADAESGRFSEHAARLPR